MLVGIFIAGTDRFDASGLDADGAEVDQVTAVLLFNHIFLPKSRPK